MLKLARFIVDKRKAFYLIFLASFIFCAVSISKVHVNDDITTYLPAHTETRRGLTLMDRGIHHLRQCEHHGIQYHL